MWHDWLQNGFSQTVVCKIRKKTDTFANLQTRTSRLLEKLLKWIKLARALYNDKQLKLWMMHQTFYNYILTCKIFHWHTTMSI